MRRRPIVQGGTKRQIRDGRLFRNAHQEVSEKTVDTLSDEPHSGHDWIYTLLWVLIVLTAVGGAFLLWRLSY
jgi:hypothetical protein